MSFSGYYKILCKNGHLSTEDAVGNYVNPDEWKCPECGARMAFETTVDQTNEPEDGKYPGDIDFECIKPPKQCKCPTCGKVHFSEPAVYKIPEMWGVMLLGQDGMLAGPFPNREDAEKACLDQKILYTTDTVVVVKLERH